jgi:hypothetical protein
MKKLRSSATDTDKLNGEVVESSVLIYRNDSEVIALFVRRAEDRYETIWASGNNGSLKDLHQKTLLVQKDLHSALQSLRLVERVLDTVFDVDNGGNTPSNSRISFVEHQLVTK